MSSDLIRWQNSNEIFITQSESLNEEGLVDIVMRSSTPLSGSQYLRLKIEKVANP